MTAESTTLHGSCLCGAVGFAVEDAFEYAFYCHCSRCRRRTGSAFAAIGGILIERLRITEGAEHVVQFRATTHSDGHVCRHCHSPLYSVVHGDRFAHVALGALSAPPSRKPDHHIQVAHKAPWYVITDDLPQYAEFAP
jgi:hypothetical protein